MPIYTTYVAYLRKFDYNPLKIFPDSLESTLIYYVQRNRGNNEVAPSKDLLNHYRQALKEGKVKESLWRDYSEEYFIQIRKGLQGMEAGRWMRKRAEEAKVHNVVLVCFEKDSQFCHRRLLAEEIAKVYGAEYKGELSKFQ